jgi:glycosyltransferase involved in cell wall biosynthesis
VIEIPIGVELERFRAPVRGSFRAELGVSGSTPLIGVVGRLVPVKAVDLFLDAAARVARSHPDAQFVVLGGGELGPELRRRAADLGLGRTVRFLGFRSDLASVFADLDVLVLSSKNEGTPVTVIEALATGCAVVATAVGGVPDLLRGGECGVLVAPGDADALAAAVGRLIDDPERRRRLGASGRDRAWGSFEVGSMVGRIAALYEELLREKRAEIASDPSAEYH